jgi:hypothetical protein
MFIQTGNYMTSTSDCSLLLLDANNPGDNSKKSKDSRKGLWLQESKIFLV